MSKPADQLTFIQEMFSTYIPILIFGRHEVDINEWPEPRLSLIALDNLRALIKKVIEIIAKSDIKQVLRDLGVNNDIIDSKMFNSVFIDFRNDYRASVDLVKRLYPEVLAVIPNQRY